VGPARHSGVERPKFAEIPVSTHNRLCTLGDLLVEGPSGPLRALRRKERLLLVYVARRAPAELHRGEFAALLWGERSEAHARHALRQALFSIRRLPDVSWR
jgi:DNA-binding SARP family transcriptional activator